MSKNEGQSAIRYQRVGFDLNPEKISGVEEILRRFASDGPTELVEAITRRTLSEQGIDGPDVTIVNSSKDMSDTARLAYLRGMKGSGGLIQPSMFMGFEEKVYLVVPAIQQAAREIGYKMELFVGVTLLHTVVAHKGLRDLLGGDFMDAMMTMFKAVGERRLLNSRTVDGTRLIDAYADQIQRKNGSLTEASKTLLTEMYLANLSESMMRSRSSFERAYLTVLEHIAYIFNLQLIDTEMEKLLHSARDHRRNLNAP